MKKKKGIMLCCECGKEHYIDETVRKKKSFDTAVKAWYNMQRYIENLDELVDKKKRSWIMWAVIDKDTNRIWAIYSTKLAARHYGKYVKKVKVVEM